MTKKRMTYEEALKYLKDKNSNTEHLSSYVGVHWCEVYDIAIEAIEKQIKYRGHDLRKNPEDLPDVGSLVLTRHLVCGKKCFTVCDYMVDGFSDGINPEELLGKTVVAWRYIEPIEEDEK